MSMLPDHPDIARTLVTGYPVDVPVIHCDRCKAEMSGREKVYLYAGLWYCRKCFIDRIIATADMESFADALAGILEFGVTTVQEIIEEEG